MEFKQLHNSNRKKVQFEFFRVDSSSSLYMKLTLKSKLKTVPRNSIFWVSNSKISSFFSLKFVPVLLNTWIFQAKLNIFEFETQFWVLLKIIMYLFNFWAFSSFNQLKLVHTRLDSNFLSLNSKSNSTELKFLSLNPKLELDSTRYPSVRLYVLLNQLYASREIIEFWTRESQYSNPYI